MKINLPSEKRVNHLTLLRQQRSITSAEFNDLSFEERFHIVCSQEGKQKYQLICEAKDGAHIVENLAAQDLLLLAKDIGLRDFCNILDLTSPEQFTCFFDFDCWRGDRLHMAAVLEWLDALLEGTDADKAFSLLRDMDRGLLTLIVKNLLGLLEEKEDTGEDGDGETTADMSDTFKTAEAVLKLLQSQAPELFHELFFAAVSDCESTLEEEVYHFRQGRLMDQGFPEYWDARKIYLYFEPHSLEPMRGEKNAARYPVENTPPSFVLSFNDNDFFSGSLGNKKQEELMWEMAFLVNRVLVADGLAFSDSDQVRSVLAEVKDYLNIGRMFILEYHDSHCATDSADFSLETFFRLGFSLTLKLGRKAQRLAQTSIGPLLDGPFHQFLKCLNLTKPRFYLGMESGNRSDSRRFESMEDIRQAEKWLTRVEIQKNLFEKHFGFDLGLFVPAEESSPIADNPTEVTLSDIFLTALANRLLGRKFFPSSLSATDLPILHQQVSSRGKLNAEFQEKTAVWLESLEKGGGDFAVFCLDIWAEEFCPLSSDALDPEYVGGLLIAGR